MPMIQVERARERAMILGVTTGLLFGLMMVGCGLWSRSLTLFADSIRAVLLASLDCFVLLVLRRIHRGQLSGFEYGHGKVEYFLNLLVAAGLILAAIGLAGLGVIRSSQPPRPPLFGLDAAFALSALNAAQNVWIFAMLRRAGRDGTSVIISGQIRARVTKLVSSIMATLAILVSSIAQDGSAGLIADLTGTAVVVLIMLWTAFRLIEGALPHLLDRILDEPQQAAINRVLIRHFHSYDELLFVRTRRSGNTMFADIGLGYEPQRSMGEVDHINRAIADELKALIPGALVTITATACSPLDPDVSNRRGETAGSVADVVTGGALN
jgi:cation diffusion facilitator family transporter